MDRRDIGFMSCRIMALAAWFYALTHLDGLLQLFYLIKRVPDSQWSVWTWSMATLAVPLAASLAAGVVMWVAAGAVGRMLVPPAVQAEASTPVQARDVLAIATAVIGLLLIAWSLSALGSGLGQWAYAKTSDDTSLIHQLSGAAVTSIIVGSAQLVVGLAMVVGSGVIGRFIIRLRGAGVDAKA
jgi:hypothetical protein